MRLAALTLCPLLSVACWVALIAACTPLPLHVQVELDAASGLDLCRRTSQCAPRPLQDACYREAEAVCRAGGQPKDCWMGQHLLSELPSYEVSRRGCW